MNKDRDRQIAYYINILKLRKIILTYILSGTVAKFVWIIGQMFAFYGAEYLS